MEGHQAMPVSSLRQVDAASVTPAALSILAVPLLSPHHQLVSNRFVRSSSALHVNMVTAAESHTTSQEGPHPRWYIPLQGRDIIRIQPYPAALSHQALVGCVDSRLLKSMFFNLLETLGNRISESAKQGTGLEVTLVPQLLARYVVYIIIRQQILLSVGSSSGPLKIREY